jgi:hypothetical protein
MSEKHVSVWVQKFRDRPFLVLQWHDPITNKRRSKSAGTADEEAAERARADLEYELNHGLFQEASSMSWDRFRAAVEEEYAAARRPATRRNFAKSFDVFEDICRPNRLRAVTGRSVSAFAASMLKRPTRGGRDGMQPSTAKVYLNFLHATLRWAVTQKLLPECPRFPKDKVPRKKPQPVPAESFERLFAKAAGDAEMQEYLLCGWLTGLPLTEAHRLEWEANDHAPWVDFAHSRIILPAAMVKAVEDQWVPLDLALRQALATLPRHGRRVFRFPTKAGRPSAARACPFAWSTWLAAPGSS